MEETIKKPLIILTGPTAVGKTSASVRLAEAVSGEIISADSMQVYRYMDIGTAKITPEEMRGIRHYLVDEITPDVPFHVYEFKKMAERAMVEIWGRNKLPIIAGGTGFYIQALLYDIDFQKEKGDRSFRHELEHLAEEKGPDYLHDRLCEVDPVSAGAIHPNNKKRVIRALEYFHETGKAISSHNAEQRQKESPYHYLYVVLTMNRQKLYDRINKRVDTMAAQGLFEETERLIQQGYTKDMVSMQAIGYKELFDYFEGRVSKEEAIEQIKKDTRHFAKRQLTWFRREKEVVFIDKESFQTEELLVEGIVRMAEERGIIRK